MTRHLWLLTVGFVLNACAPTAAVRLSERAGLGTSWGETRESPVSFVPFDRDDPERPVAVSVLHYDDRDGVRALGGEPAAGDGPVGGAEAAGGALQVRLVDSWGVSLPTFARGGRLLVEGRRGQRYAIEIANRSGGRIEAVATVDGLDVLDGRHGALDKRGYVLRPGETFRIDGFRRSQEEVAAFRFGDVAESYAAQTGDDANVGVIGVAFFAERGSAALWREGEAARRAGANPFPGRFAPPPSRDW